MQDAGRFTARALLGNLGPFMRLNRGHIPALDATVTAPALSITMFQLDDAGGENYVGPANLEQHGQRRLALRWIGLPVENASQLRHHPS
jgi:hypothetical protein